MGSALVPGQVFAGYRIERLLGAGGMGEVYLARDRGLPRHIALKVLSRAVGDDADVRRRFQREADTVARLSHPNIVTIHARGEEHGQLWISMAYVAGTDLSAVLAAGPLTPERAVRITVAAAEALEHAHDNGILHRDVKPANILLTGGPSERALLTDFGIAKGLEDSVGLTRTNEVYASFQYTAPERLDFGAAVDRRADVYSLGCTLYQMLTGEIPYPGSNAAQLIHGHLYRATPRPSERNPEVPAAFDAVVARALAKAPEDRFRDCGELARAVLAAATGRGTTMPAPPPPPFPSRPTLPTEGYGVYPPTVTAAAGTGGGAPREPADAVEDVPAPRRSRRTVLGVATVLVAGLAAAVAVALSTAMGQDAGPSGAPATIEQLPLVGKWQGTAEQDDAGTLSHYRMTITLRSGAVGTVVGSTFYEVSDGDCTGELTLRERADGGLSATLYEQIVSGPCIPNGNVTVTAGEGGGLDFVYTGVTRSGRPERVTADLDRVG
ncbi:serine/threonine-protein kinase [Nocardia takedensis]